MSVASTQVDGMTDFIALPYTHPFIMNADEVLQQALHFIEAGRFAVGAATTP